MNCSCGAWNHEDEHRCRRCGRRLHGDPVPAGSALPAPAPVEPAKPAAPAATAAALRIVRRTAQQQTLFGRDASRGTPPASAAPRPQRRREADGRSPLTVEQRQLDFLVPQVARRTSDAVICCRAPVASREHRVLAAMVGLSLVLTAVSFAGMIYLAMGGELIVSRSALLVVAGALVTVGVFYQLLFAVAGGDTPGMRFTGLQLLDFDGRRPGVDKRVIRVGATCLSVGAAGLGLIWALADEDKLTWQDHISKTFPTPVIQPPRS